MAFTRYRRRPDCPGLIDVGEDASDATLYRDDGR